MICLLSLLYICWTDERKTRLFYKKYSCLLKTKITGVQQSFCNFELGIIDEGKDGTGGEVLRNSL